MFDFSFAELALIVIVAVVFIGPKDLPVVIRAVSKAMRAMRELAREVREAFEEAAQESGLKEAADDIHREVRMIKGDDGKYYESYDLPTPPLPKAPPEDSHE